MLLDAFRRYANCCSLIPSCSNHCHELNVPVRPEFVGYRACHSPQICSAIDTYRPCLVNENASNHYTARICNLPLQHPSGSEKRWHSALHSSSSVTKLLSFIPGCSNYCHWKHMLSAPVRFRAELVILHKFAVVYRHIQALACERKCF
jgi:hypothetical protein